MAECHPVGFQWVEEAKARGARVIHVDPRFTRTRAVSDKHIPIRAGSDVVLLGALINHIITNDLWFKEYVVAYTNAATLINENFRDTEDLGGLFSGYDPETGQYDPSTWAYQEAEAEPEERGDPWRHGRRAGQRGSTARPRPGAARRDPAAPADGIPDPQAALRPLHPGDGARRLRHQPRGFRLSGRVPSSRTPGASAPPASPTPSAGPSTPSGAQFIRTATILQLLMGNVGRPGSGIMALRGHASIQGSTDIPTLFNLLPGYLPMPKAGTHDTLADYLEAVGSKKQKGFWANADAYMVSLLKAWWGDAARAGQRLGLRLSAAAVRPARHLPDRDGNARRRGRGLLPAGPESRGRVGARPHAAARHVPPEVAGGARPQHDRVGDLVEGRSGDRVGRTEDRGHRDRGVLLPRGDARGEGGNVHPDAAADAVAAQGARAARRLPERIASSSSSSASGSRRGWPVRPTSATGRCWT